MTTDEHDRQTERTLLVWRWRNCADPDQPSRTQTKREELPHAPAILHPLTDRFGHPCVLLAQGRNGNRLIEFADGFRVVAPLYATRAAK